MEEGRLFKEIRYIEKRHDEKAKVDFKFMTSQTGQQIIVILKLPNISRNKDNQAMKFGQIIKRQKYLSSKIRQNEAGRLVPDLFLLFKKALYEEKASRQHLSFDIFW